MKQNKLEIIIKKPVNEVFEFTTNPKNTHLWISSIEKEIADQFPPKIGTIYKNRGKNFKWNYYKVIDYEPFKKFTLSDLDNIYYVRYEYYQLSDNSTKMIYFEWVNKGRLENPFTQDVLNKLKFTMEKH